MTWAQSGKQVVMKSPAEWSAEAASADPHTPAPCSDCGCTLAPGGKCARCGKSNLVAAQRQVDRDRWLCPQCGCRDWGVLDTRESADGNLSRTRYCRNCGKDGPRMYTDELPRKLSPGGDVIDG